MALALFFVVPGSAPCLVAAPTEEPTSSMELPPQDSARLTPVVRAVQRALPSVVNISTERVVRVSDPFTALFNEFVGGHQRYSKESIPLGSGVIIDSSGLVVTNYHVVRRASQIIVRLFNGKTCTGRLVAYDLQNDLALLQLSGQCAESTNWQPIEFALPDDLFLGETVVSVGNPFGLEHSVTAGVLSARNRSLREGNVVFNDILQTDAAINLGNSGGPLINLDGQLIGLNVAIRRDAEGIGFGIPLGRIETVLGTWLVPSRFSLAICGFVPRAERRDGNLRVVAGDVTVDSPAADAGLQEGDAIDQINGTPVARVLDASRILARLQPGDELSLSLVDGRVLNIPIRAMTPEGFVVRRLGVRLQELTSALNTALGLPKELRGLAISEVVTGSQFEALRVQRGSIIERVDGVDTATVEDVFTILRDKSPGDLVEVIVGVAVETMRNQVAWRRFDITVALN